MKKTVEGSIAWAKGEPPRIRGPWESAICELAEKGDARFIDILREHVASGVIRSPRAINILNGDGDAN